MEANDGGYDAIAAAMQAGDFAAAESVLERVFAETGGQLSLRVANLAVVAKMRLGKFGDALQLLTAVEPFQPDDRNQQRNTALCLMRTGQSDRARPVLERAVERHPDDAELHFLYSHVLPLSGSPNDYKAAQDHAGRAAELVPDNAGYHTRYGFILQHSGRAAEAEVALRRAIELDPNLAEAWVSLGNALLELDQVDPAIRAYETGLAIQPQHEEARTQLAALRKIEKPAARDRLARYPRMVREFDDMQRIIDRYVLSDFSDPPPLLSVQSKVFTMGSCFAKNIANSLRKYGATAKSVLYPDDINNTYANKYLLEWLLGSQGETYQAYQETFGDAFRAEQTAYLRECAVVILSLGVAPCFFDRETGAFALTFGQNLNIALQNRRYKFRTTTVTENVDNLREIIRMLRELNPNVTIFLTVSPVPLKATFERGSAIVADCVSKSTLRVAAEEIVRLELPGIYYWPSFEIVRWAGGHTGDALGVDDGSSFHVTQALIERIMYNFVATFGTPDLAARAAALREAEAEPALT
jgi:tetratricopeptide (TPR) repeat protein